MSNHSGRHHIPCKSSTREGCSSCQKAAALDKKMDKMREDLASLEKERLELNVQINSVLIHDGLIRRMSREIVSMIFRHFLPNDIMALSLISMSKSSARYTLNAPLILSGTVSREWRKIALSIPQLWAVIPLFVAQWNVDSLPSLMKKWVARSGYYPLSINIYASVAPSQKLMEVINGCSSRWLDLKYEGPSETLSQFSSAAHGISPLQTLSLRPFVHGRATIFNLGNFILRPNRLEMLCIPSLGAVRIDWSGLTDVLIEDKLCVAECLEVLRRAQRLIRCTLSPDHETQTLFPLPHEPIMHQSIVDLTLIGPYYRDILGHLRCPSLETLTISMFGGHASMADLALFIGQSQCSLMTLNLEDVKLVQEDIIQLCQGVPTLHHLCICLAESLPEHLLFSRLAEATLSTFGVVPLYVPKLRSLTLRQNYSMNLTLLPSIFTFSASREVHRTNLRNVEISFGQYHIPQIGPQDISDLDRERQFLLSLREHGVKLKIETRTPYGTTDLL